MHYCPDNPTINIVTFRRLLGCISYVPFQLFYESHTKVQLFSTVGNINQLKTAFLVSFLSISGKLNHFSWKNQDLQFEEP